MPRPILLGRLTIGLVAIPTGLRCRRIVSLFLLISVSNSLMIQSIMAQPGAPPSPVVVSKIAATSQSASQSFVGTLEPIRKSVIGSAIDGRVTEILVDDGDPVVMLNDQFDSVGKQLGQPIVQLRTVALDIEIAAAEVELNIRQDAEKELKQTLPTEIESASATIDEIKARLNYSKSNYERLKELNRSGGGIPRREIDQAFSTYSSQLQSIIVADSLLKRLSTTRELRLLQATSRVDAQRSEIQRLHEMKDQYTIRAPFAGYVTLKMTELGEWVARGDNVVEIVQLDPIDLKINVPQSYIGRLQNSLDKCRESNTTYTAQVTVDSIPDLLTGEVVRIVPQADLRSRSFPVIIRINNPGTGFGHLLKAGMLATASLFVGREEEILLVKKDALVLGGRDTSLFVTNTDPQTNSTTVRSVPVKIGASIGDWIQVTGAIAEHELVVIEGNERLQPGQVVQIAKEVTDILPEKSMDNAIQNDGPNLNAGSN